MSQAGYFKIPAAILPPSVATSYVTDSGTAVPAAHVLDILTAVVAAGTNPIQSTGATNVVTINVQKSQAIAAADATKIGLSNFNSAQFTVDANGFVSTAGGGVGNTITGNSGGALSPTAGNWNILGASTVAGTSPVTTSGSVSTLTVNVQKAQAIASTDATKVGLAVFDSADFTVDANGFVSAATTGFLKTLTGNSGGAIAPVANNINTVGTGSITISGAGSTLTTQLTGLTNHAIQIGAGTATLTQLGAGTTGQVLQTNTGADPTWSTATYPSTTTVSQLLYSSSANVVAGLATANRGVLTTGATGVPVITALATDGQLIIGSTAGTPAAATLTAGAGISITNASNSITIAVTGSGFTWSDTSGAFSPLKENGYFITGTATGTLPASPTQGDTIEFFVDTTQILTIQAAGSQIIRLGQIVSSAGGTMTSTLQGDSVRLTYRASDTCWCCIGGHEGVWQGA